MGIAAFPTSAYSFASKTAHRTFATYDGFWGSSFDYAIDYVRTALRNNRVDDPQEFADSVQYIVDYSKIDRNSTFDEVATMLGLRDYVSGSGGRLKTGLVPLLLWGGDGTYIDPILTSFSSASGDYYELPPVALLDWIRQNGTPAYRTDAIAYCKRAFDSAVARKIHIDPAILDACMKLNPPTATSTNGALGDWITQKLSAADSDILGNPALRDVLEFALLSPTTNFYEPSRTLTVSASSYPAVSVSGGARFIAEILQRQANSGADLDADLLAKLDTVNPNAANLIRYVSLQYQLNHKQNFNKDYLAKVADADHGYWVAALINAQGQNYLKTRNMVLGQPGVEEAMVTTATTTVRVYLDEMGFARQPQAGDIVSVAGNPLGLTTQSEFGHSAALTAADIQNGFVDVAVTLPRSGEYELRSTFRSDSFTSPASLPLLVKYGDAPSLKSEVSSFWEHDFGGGHWGQWFRVNLTFNGTFDLADVDQTKITATFRDTDHNTWYDLHLENDPRATDPYVVIDSSTHTVQLWFRADADAQFGTAQIDLTIAAGGVKDIAGNSNTTDIHYQQVGVSTPLQVMTAVPPPKRRMVQPHVADADAIDIYKTVRPGDAALWELRFRNAGLWPAETKDAQRPARGDLTIPNIWSGTQPLVQSVIDVLNGGVDTTQKRTNVMNTLNGFMTLFNGISGQVGAASTSDTTRKLSHDSTGSSISQFDKFWNAYQQYYDATGDNPLNRKVTAGTIDADHPHGVLEIPADVSFGDLTSTITAANGCITTMGNQSQLDMLGNQSNMQNMNSACEAMAKMIEVWSQIMDAVLH